MTIHEDAHQRQTTFAHPGDIPEVTGWDIGPGLVAIRCPRCGGIHTHAAGGGPRIPHCPPSMIRPGVAVEYRVVDTAEPAPEWVPEALRRPLGDLGVALELVGNGHPLGASTLAFVFDALAASGFADEVAAIKAEAGWPDRAAQRSALAEAIRRAGGGPLRRRLAEALRRAWRGQTP